MTDQELDAHISQLTLKDLEDLYSSISDYELNPISIEEFLDSPEFLGPVFEDGLFPYWREALKEIYPSPFYSPYWLISFRGAIGLGKTSIACVGMAYDLYRLLCLAKPQKNYGLLPHEKIIFAIFNVTLSLAQDVVWDKMSQIFTHSPFFSKLLGPLGTKPKYRDTLFPKRIDFFMGSRLGHTLGKAIINCILDEANFDVVQDQVYLTFNSVLRRMESRFMNKGGGVAGKIWIVSSESDKFSTVNKIVDSYKKNKGVYISQAALWDVKPERYGSERFIVYKGSEVRSPEILIPNSSLYLEEPHNCINVPIEHRDSFDADIHSALRDLAGASTTASYKLFRIKDRLHKSLSVTPLFPETIKLDFDDDVDQIYNHLKLPGYFKNCLNKDFPRNIHIDVGLTGDRLGLSASYVSEFTERSTRDISTFEKITETVPRVVTEWCLGIEPTPGKQVPLYKVRLFFNWLTNQNYIIGKITADGFQSADLLQSLQKMGYKAELLSMDRSSLAYIQFRNMVYEGRWCGPKNALLERELLELEVSTDGEKVDHPKKNSDGTNGSKDCADACGGSAYTAMNDSNSVKLLHYVEKESYESNNKVKNMFWPAGD